MSAQLAPLPGESIAVLASDPWDACTELGGNNPFLGTVLEVRGRAFTFRVQAPFVLQGIACEYFVANRHFAEAPSGPRDWTESPHYSVLRLSEEQVRSDERFVGHWRGSGVLLLASIARARAPVPPMQGPGAVDST